MPRLIFSKVGQGHRVKMFSANRKVLQQGISMRNIKTSSLLSQRLSFFKK